VQNQRTINISDRTYAALIKLVGRQGASGFVEEVLQPFVAIAENREVATIHSPRLADPSQIADFVMEKVLTTDGRL